MDPRFTGLLAIEHRLDLLAEATRAQLAACVAPHGVLRTRLGNGLLRAGRSLVAVQEPEVTPVVVARPCTSC